MASTNPKRMKKSTIRGDFRRFKRNLFDADVVEVEDVPYGKFSATKVERLPNSSRSLHNWVIRLKLEDRFFQNVYGTIKHGKLLDAIFGTATRAYEMECGELTMIVLLDLRGMSTRV